MYGITLTPEFEFYTGTRLWRGFFHDGYFGDPDFLAIRLL